MLLICSLVINYLYEIDWGLSSSIAGIPRNCGDCACRYVVPSLLPGMNAVAEARVTTVQVFSFHPHCTEDQWMGLEENLQETPIFHPKIHGFL